jgi:hypothetical protein
MGAFPLPGVRRLGGLRVLAHAETRQLLSFLLRGRTFLLLGRPRRFLVGNDLTPLLSFTSMSVNLAHDIEGISKDSRDKSSYAKEGTTGVCVCQQISPNFDTHGDHKLDWPSGGPNLKGVNPLVVIHVAGTAPTLRRN